ncbi:ABC transporter substrate-binding protein [Photobacterium sp. SDRW27]|uniref:ABC transporter substrate-binding protein n=1 Tax=Photobacterium obscurum TaxID=2829490 RepID=UPI002242CD53|nr:ABC transporter substrate-binding protein [Photobacterium obscurum]MCW8331599.1 ABC transporter substrate-binding protein [Photobacterium obscurum]
MFKTSFHRVISRSIKCLLIGLPLVSCYLAAAAPTDENRSILTVVPEYKDRIIANFNPFSKASMPTTHEFIFEPLIIFNSLQNNKPEYRLATSYRLDKDLKGITFTLRDNVTWSDGKPFTADDVVFSFYLAQKYPELDSHGINQWVEKVYKRPSGEVYFKLVKPNALVAYTLVLLPIVPKHQWENVADPVSYANATPIGTGPYTQVEALNESSYLQCQNPSYWQAELHKIDCLRYPKVTNNDDFIARIAKGEFDWTGSFIPDIERHYASYSPDFKYWLPPASNISLMFNFKAVDPEIQALFAQVEFRRAISMSVQRQLLIDIASFGQGVPSTFASGMSQRFTRWADPVVTEKYLPYMTFNPALAIDRLNELKVVDKDGDGWRELPSGKKLELTILTPKGWSDFNTTALLLVEMMEQVGIRVSPVQVDFTLFVEQLAHGDYTMALTNYPQGPTPFKYFDTAFNSAYQAPQYPRYAMHFYQNPRIDELLNQFPTVSLAHKRLAIIRELNEIIASQQVTVPLYNTVQFYQYNTQRFEGWFNENNPIASPLIWPQAPERLLHVLALRPKDQ